MRVRGTAANEACAARVRTLKILAVLSYDAVATSSPSPEKLMLLMLLECSQRSAS
jgi:hypothetical protein